MSLVLLFFWTQSYLQWILFSRTLWEFGTHWRTVRIHCGCPCHTATECLLVNYCQMRFVLMEAKMVHIEIVRNVNTYVQVYVYAKLNRVLHKVEDTILIHRNKVNNFDKLLWRTSVYTTLSLEKMMRPQQ